MATVPVPERVYSMDVTTDYLAVALADRFLCVYHRDKPTELVIVSLALLVHLAHLLMLEVSPVARLKRQVTAHAHQLGCPDPRRQVFSSPSSWQSCRRAWLRRWQHRRPRLHSVGHLVHMLTVL